MAKQIEKKNAVKLDHTSSADANNHLMDPKTSKLLTTTFAMKSFLAGGIAGMLAKTAIAPLDRIKILLQAQNLHYKHLGIVGSLKTIVKKESAKALYKGNGAQMVRIFPYAATQFTSFEIYKQLLANVFGPKSHISKFYAGSLAGVTAVTVTYPLDLIRAKLAFQVSGHHVYKGIFHTFATVLKKEGGISGLYRGFVPTIMGMVPYAGLSFYTFEFLKQICISKFPMTTKENPNRPGTKILGIPAKLLCGGFAGAMAQSVAYPLDVARRRMQLSMTNPDTYKYSKNWFKTLQLVYQESGIVKGLYRGMSVNYLRAIPMVAVSFSTYEVMKQALHLDTGIET